MKNNYTINGNVVFVEAKRGRTGEIFTFQCDVADFDILKQYSWHVHRKSISVACWYRVNNKGKSVSLQRKLTGSKFVDFLNGDKLDFRRCNMVHLEKQKRDIKIGAKLVGNRIAIHGDTATVWTKKAGGRAGAFLVDAADLDFIRKYTWFIMNTGYPTTWVPGGRENSKQLLLHRALTGAERGEQVDHINRIRVDARRKNLRICKDSQNKHNVGVCKNNTSGATGVQPRGKKWQARIMINREEMQKTFPTFQQAVAQRKEWEETYNPAGLS